MSRGDKKKIYQTNKASQWNKKSIASSASSSQVFPLKRNIQTFTSKSYETKQKQEVDVDVSNLNV